ncbi:Tetratricopeptide repeat protein 37 [Clydaea vesicula]|uniref:Tetratricopeptide repeat protein 37 n=1 Tax=Clydaea vesicula TaxID=447962 RepID=A0AAD5U6G5_9FUNG|nr:Tetratricopeptide repeat protein 37 [Clydaea vesicula]
MSSKSLLKSARECIEKKEFEAAKGFCEQVLENDPKNYNALVFLGLSETNLEEFEQAEKTYKKAINISPNMVIAYQGYITLLEKSNQLEKLIDVLLQTIELFFAANDGKKCLDFIIKLNANYEKLNDRKRIISGLNMFLPESRYFNLIKDQDNLENTTNILLKIAKLQEQEDQEHFAKEVRTRSMRLGSDTTANIKLAVEKEIILSSKLSLIYEDILKKSELSSSESTSFKQKLLEFYYKKIQYLPVGTEKNDLWEVILNLSKGLILENSNYTLAYKCLIYFNDDDFDILDHSIFEKAIETCDKDSDLYRMCRGFLIWKVDRNIEDSLKEFLAAIKNSPSLFSYKCLASIYTEIRDPESALNCVSRCDEELKIASDRTGTKEKILLIQAQSLLQLGRVQNSGTKNYLSQALGIFKIILLNNDNHGVGEALQVMGKFEDAAIQFEKVLQLDKNFFQCKKNLAWLRFLQGNYSKSLELLQEMIEVENLEKKLEADCLFQIGRVHWEISVENRTDKSRCLNYFLRSARLDPENPNTFNFLGKYYLEVENDHLRAIKCFQKSHLLIVEGKDLLQELENFQSPSHSLTNLYLNDRKIDLALEILDSIRKSNPRDYWSLKMLGVLKLDSHEYVAAISYLQSSLRINANDTTTWECLADSYFKEGKFLASLKAYNRVLELDCNNLYVKFQIALVHLKLGQFETACQNFKKILEINKLKEHLPTVRKMCDSYLLYVSENIEIGAYGHAAETINTGDLCSVSRLIPGYLNLISLETINNLKKVLFTFLREKEEPDFTIVCLDSLLTLSISSYKCCILFLKSNTSLDINFSETLAFYWSDVGLHYFWKYQLKKNKEVNEAKTHFEEAVKSLNVSLKLYPHSSVVWNNLGCILFYENLALSQHSFIRAIEFDSKNAAFWANLGLLYLKEKDFQLAHQAFGQSLFNDPENIASWFGKALISLLKNPNISMENTSVFEQFEHALDLGGAFPEINLNFAYQHYLHYTANNSDMLDSSSFNVPIFCLFKYIGRFLPVDNYPISVFNKKPVAVALNLLGLFQERQCMFQEAIYSFEKCLVVLNDSSIQSNDSLMFKVKENLARCLCGHGTFEKAVKIYRDITANIAVEKGVPEMCMGLSFFFNGDISESLKWFENSLKNASDIGGYVFDQIGVMISQVLYSLNKSNLGVVKQHLLSCVSRNSQNVNALLSLTALGLVGNDLNLATSGAAEIIKLAPDILNKANLEEDANFVLSRLFLQQGNKKISVGFFSKAIHTMPHRAERWSRLGKLMHQMHPNLSFSASLAARVSTLLPRSELSRSEIASMYTTFGVTLLSSGNGLKKDPVATDSQSNILKALRASPTDLESWFALALDLRSKICHITSKPYLYLNSAQKSDMALDLIKFKIKSVKDILNYIINKNKINNLIQECQTKKELAKKFKLTQIFYWSLQLECELTLLEATFVIDTKMKIEMCKLVVAKCEKIFGECSSSDIKASSLVIIGRGYKTIGDIKSAIGYLKQATSLLPNSSSLYEELGQLYTESKLFLAAEICYRAAIKLCNANKSSPLLRLAILALKQNNFSLSSEALNEASNLKEADIYTLKICKLLQGLLQFKSGNEGKALKTFHSILDLESSKENDQLSIPFLHYYLGVIYKSKNEIEKYDEEYELELKQFKNWDLVGKYLVK